MGRQDTNIPKRRRRRVVALGDLNEKISIQTRNQQSQFESTTGAAQEVFTTVATPWALVETYRGQNFFDSIEQGLNPTHVFYIRNRPMTDEEAWLLYRDSRFDILDVENLDERSEFLKLTCRATGKQVMPSNSNPVQGAWG
jgi:SPP1 family predicted phage head-tail adaptor